MEASPKTAGERKTRYPLCRAPGRPAPSLFQWPLRRSALSVWPLGDTPPVRNKQFRVPDNVPEGTNTKVTSAKRSLFCAYPDLLYLSPAGHRGATIQSHGCGWRGGLRDGRRQHRGLSLVVPSASVGSSQRGVWQRGV